MQTSVGPEAVVSVYITDHCKMGTQLLATALRGSRYNVDVVGSGVASDEIRDGLKKHQVDIALISARLKDGRAAGFNLTREIRLSFPKTDIVMILDTIDEASISEAFRAGAVGILSRDEPFEVLCKSIYAVFQGQVWANSRQLRVLLDTLTQMPRAFTLSGNDGQSPQLLTKREESLAYLVAEGLTNRDISRQLNLSEHTVRNYLFRIFNKLGTSNRLELALYVINRREENQVSQR
jgi:DNA-binding NarL/FixJ family response regulator